MTEPKYRIHEVAILSVWEKGETRKKIKTPHWCNDLEKHRKLIAMKHNVPTSVIRFTYEEKDDSPENE